MMQEVDVHLKKLSLTSMILKYSLGQLPAVCDNFITINKLSSCNAISYRVAQK